jgi:site-specific recombinase XerD
MLLLKMYVLDTTGDLRMTDLPAPQKDQDQAVIMAPPGLAPIHRPLSQNPAAVYLAGLAPSSKRTQEAALDIMARLLLDDPEASWLDLPWEVLRFQHTAAIRARLALEYKYTTANRLLSALRGVLKAAWQLGLMPAEDYHLAASVENVKGQTVPAGRHVPSGELVALLGTCDQSQLGIRDAAVLSLLYGAGLRRAELVALDLADWNLAENRLLVTGKGQKERQVPVANGAAKALQDWLDVRGEEPGPLFWGVGNRNRGGRLTSGAVYKMLQARAKAAGVTKLSPHDFRRTYVGELLDAGADIVTVQKLAGHADVTTTARYDRRDEKAKQKAVELLHVPYQKRTLEAE